MHTSIIKCVSFFYGKFLIISAIMFALASLKKTKIAINFILISLIPTLCKFYNYRLKIVIDDFVFAALRDKNRCTLATKYLIPYIRIVNLISDSYLTKLELIRFINNKYFNMYETGCIT